MSTEVAGLLTPPAMTPTKLVVTLPPLPKLVSSRPLALKRATANSLSVPLALMATPATTIFPSDCSARAFGEFMKLVKEVIATPLLPKVVSSAPLAR